MYTNSPLLSHTPNSTSYFSSYPFSIFLALELQWPQQPHPQRFLCSQPPIPPPPVPLALAHPFTSHPLLHPPPCASAQPASAALVSPPLIHYWLFMLLPELGHLGLLVRGSEGWFSMAKKSVGDLTAADLKGKKVFLRADLNVPLDDNQNITDDTRIRAAIPTIKHLIQNGAKVLLTSHLGRPKGVTPKFSLAPLVPRLSELLGIQVVKADDSIGPDEEEKNDPEFAKKLASLADLYVNDAFGTAHRAHASTEGVTKFLKPSVAGFLLQKELDYLVGAVSNPKRPFAAIVGGSKVSSKIGVIESLLEKVDILLLGGGMIFTFYKAQGLSVGSSLVEEDKLGLATSLLEKAKAKGVSLLLPTDVVIADKFAPDANSQIVSASAIPDGWMGLDIGPDSIKTFNDALATTKTVIWNGPMGVFEFEKFAAGTEAVAKKLAELSGQGVTTIIGGGDSVAAVEKVGVADVMSHISTGGGASLELLEGKQLPGVLALDEATPVPV
ncbi:Phosphoglycerate kinase family protein [Quillaja saponaria]|uniref:Phosphoglycerate kinase n=1 Tax=Quillaja saponaria TaxID=32244 RepID=A0AAD7QIF1_QUISA|nr:Phosphoglycerate kinase family protein [Quillaja saponaria]